MVQFAQDTFIRANASSWGTASDGQTWTGDTSFSSISSNTGVLSTASPSAFPQLVLGAKIARNAEILTRISLGNSINSYTINARIQSNGNYYCVSLASSLVAIQKVVSFGATNLASVSASIVASSFYWIRFRLISTNLYAKYWLDGSNEPANWTLSLSGDLTYPQSGQFGVLAGLNTTAPTSITSFTVTSAIDQRIIGNHKAIVRIV